MDGNSARIALDGAPTIEGLAAAIMARMDFNTISDEALGQRLLAARLAAEAERQGISPRSIPADLAAAWVHQLRTQEADAVTNIPLEKALTSAAKGEYEKAGRIFRAYTLDAVKRVHEVAAVHTLRARTAAARAAGAKGGQKSKGGKIPSNIDEELRKLVDGGRSERDARSVLRERYDVSSQAIGQALKKAKSKLA